MKFGIFYPFYTCMSFCFVAALMIFILWDENDYEKYKNWVYENNHHFDEDQLKNKNDNLK